MTGVALGVRVAGALALAACEVMVDGGNPAADAAGDDGAAADAPGIDGADAHPPVDAALDAFARVCPPTGPLDCSAGTGTGEAPQCADGPSCYLPAVKAAVNGTIAANPAWFGEGPGGCPLILDVERFMDAVVARLVGAGLCALRDPNAPGEEVTVKHDNAFSENFDIVASTGCARYGDGIYTGYCAPAWW